LGGSVTIEEPMMPRQSYGSAASVCGHALMVSIADFRVVIVVPVLLRMFGMNGRRRLSLAARSYPREWVKRAALV
jgi:hypothetical protein